jgi:hypothetical protein
MQFVVLRSQYPGTSAWYSEQSGTWCAALPDARDPGAIISAPSPGALTHMLAAPYAAARSGIS